VREWAGEMGLGVVGEFNTSFYERVGFS
jgi:hypothetical protein